MRKKTSTIMAWLLAASVTVTSLSAGTVTAYAQEEMPLAEAGTVTESAEEFGDSSDSIMLCSLTLFMCDEIFKL